MHVRGDAVILAGIFAVGALIMWANIPPKCRHCHNIYGTRRALWRHVKKAHRQ